MISKRKQNKMADLLFGIRRPQRPRQFQGLIDIANFSDNELRARYRFGQQAIQYITDLLADDLCRDTRQNHASPPLQQVLIALRFFAIGSFLQVIGDTAGVDKSTVSRVVTNVSIALSRKPSHFIKWPTAVESVASKSAFYRLGTFLPL